MKEGKRLKLEIVTVSVGQMATNCYLLIDHEHSEAIVIDPGDDADYLSESLEKLKIKPRLLLATHGHFDHLMAARALQLNYQVPFLIGADDIFLVARMAETAKHFLGLTYVDPPPLVTQKLQDGQILAAGALKLQVLHTPGHTPGSVSFYLPQNQVIFVGDLFFAQGGVGRTDFSYSEGKALQSSLARIFLLPKATRVFPGHGPLTSLKREIRYHRL